MKRNVLCKRDGILCVMYLRDQNRKNEDLKALADSIGDLLGSALAAQIRGLDQSLPQHSIDRLIDPCSITRVSHMLQQQTCTTDGSNWVCLLLACNVGC